MPAVDHDVRPAASGRRTSIDGYLLAVLTIPLVLLAANREWLFPFGDPTDSWLNFTYYFEWGIRDPVLYLSYKAVRLSWILKGVLAYRIFPPLTAHYVLHLTMFFAAIVLFYFIVKLLFNAWIGALATTAFATHSIFHSMISFEWDYTTHDAAVNLLLALLLLVLAARGIRSRLTLFIAGMAAASAIQSPYVIGYMPVLGFWYFAQRRADVAPNPWSSVGYFLAGGALATALYGLISASVGGPFWYYAPQLSMALHHGSGSRYAPGYWMPAWAAIRTIKGLQVPAAMAVASVGMLAYVWPRRRTLQYGPAILTCGVGFLLCMAVHVAGHLYGNSFLIGGQFLVALAPWQFLAAAALLASVLGSRSGQSAADIGLACAVYVLFIAPLVLWQAPGFGSDAMVELWNRLARPLWPNVAFDVDSTAQFLPLVIAVPFVAISAQAALLSFAVRAARWVTAGLLIAVFLSIANVVSASLPLRMYAAGLSACGSHQDLFKAVIDSYRAIRAVDSDYTLNLWYKAPDVVPFPIGWCRTQAGTPVITMQNLYGAIWGARYYSSLRAGHPPYPQRVGTMGKRLRSIVATEFGGNGEPGPQGILGGYLGTRDFSALPHARYWLAVTPNPLRVAVLSTDPLDGGRAIATLEKLDTQVDVLGTTRIHEGVISFCITFLQVTHGEPSG